METNKLLCVEELLRLEGRALRLKGEAVRVERQFVGLPRRPGVGNHWVELSEGGVNTVRERRVGVHLSSVLRRVYLRIESDVPLAQRARLPLRMQKSER